jgi:3-hydroxybutyrate dehydrogenase
MKTKTVLVTGGTRGIGRAIVGLLLNLGYRVVFTGQTRASVQTMGEAFGAAEGHVLDLEHPSSIKGLAQVLSSESLYGIVNNAGICKTQPLDELGTSWEQVLQVNLLGPMRLVQELEDRLIEGGRVINISSQLASVARPGYGAYSASKAGLNALTKVWANELGTRRITVNAVAPGWVETEMTESDLARLATASGFKLQDYRQELEGRLDLKRFNTPQEVANIVAFLLSPESSGITGRIIEMAGPSM